MTRCERSILPAHPVDSATDNAVCCWSVFVHSPRPCSNCCFSPWLRQGVFVDEAGYVAEGPTMNLGVLTHDGELVIPPFERSLAGCTVRRLMDLVEEVTPQSLA